MHDVTLCFTYAGDDNDPHDCRMYIYICEVFGVSCSLLMVFGLRLSVVRGFAREDMSSLHRC